MTGTQNYEQTWPRPHTLPPLRVMSVQSHVSRDYVGNKAAVPILQALGLHVDVLNSCLYSSLFVHEGQKSDASDAEKVINGLRLAMDHPLGGGFPGASTDNLAMTTGNDLSAILTGYIPRPDYCQSIVKNIKDMKEKNPATFWLCDPVLGDMGHLYVEPEMIDIYRDSIMYADCITPNWYELGLLAYGQGSPVINNFESAQAAIRKLFSNTQAKGPGYVICSSLNLNETTLMTVIYDKQHDKFVSYEYPLRAKFFIAGTGDAFSAILLSLILREKERTDTVDIDQLVALTLSLTQAVIEVTLESYPRGEWRSVNPAGGSMAEILSCFNCTTKNADSVDSRWSKFYQSIVPSRKEY